MADNKKGTVLDYSQAGRMTGYDRMMAPRRRFSPVVSDKNLEEIENSPASLRGLAKTGAEILNAPSAIANNSVDSLGNIMEYFGNNPEIIKDIKEAIEGAKTYLTETSFKEFLTDVGNGLKNVAIDYGNGELGGAIALSLITDKGFQALGKTAGKAIGSSAGSKVNDAVDKAFESVKKTTESKIDAHYNNYLNKLDSSFDDVLATQKRVSHIDLDKLKTENTGNPNIVYFKNIKSGDITGVVPDMADPFFNEKFEMLPTISGLSVDDLNNLNDYDKAVSAFKEAQGSFKSSAEIANPAKFRELSDFQPYTKQMLQDGKYYKGVWDEDFRDIKPSDPSTMYEYRPGLGYPYDENHLWNKVDVIGDVPKSLVFDPLKDLPLTTRVGPDLYRRFQGNTQDVNDFLKGVVRESPEDFSPRVQTSAARQSGNLGLGSKAEVATNRLLTHGVRAAGDVASAPVINEVMNVTTPKTTEEKLSDNYSQYIQPTENVTSDSKTKIKYKVGSYRNRKGK